MKKYLILILLFSLLRLNAQIDLTDIIVNNSTIHVNTEIDIAVRKSDTGEHVIIGWNSFRPGLKLTNQGWALSNNGGVSFYGNSNEFPHLNQSQVKGDPVVGFNATNNPFMFTMMPDGELGFTSHTGTNWNNIVVVPSLNNKSILWDKIMGIAVDDNLMSNGHNNVYIAGTNFGTTNSGSLIFSRMVGGTNTFSQPIELINNTRFSHGAEVKVGSDNKVFICWTDYGTNGAFPGSNIGFARSIDNGLNFSHVTSTAFGICGIRIGNIGLSSYCDTRVNDFPSMAVDRSCLQKRGRIYIVWADQKDCNANPSNKGSIIKMRFSDNDGDSWSPEFAISKPEHSHAWFPRIAVDDRTGLITVAYFTYDKKGECDKTNTFVSYSSDGGSTWGHLKVSDTHQEPKQVSGLTVGYSGDYIGIATHNNNCYVAWHDRRSGSYKVMLSKVRFNLPLKINYARDYTIDGNMTVSTPLEIFAKGKIDLKPGITIQTLPGAFLHIRSETSIELNNNFYANNPNVIIEIGPVDCYDIGSTQMSIPNINHKFNLDSLIIQNSNQTALFKIYPNPTSNFLNIESVNNKMSNFDFEILDAMGKRVLYGKSGEFSKVEVTLDYLPPAIYFVKINQTSYGKIIISN